MILRLKSIHGSSKLWLTRPGILSDSIGILLRVAISCDRLVTTGVINYAEVKMKDTRPSATLTVYCQVAPPAPVDNKAAVRLYLFHVLRWDNTARWNVEMEGRKEGFYLKTLNECGDGRKEGRVLFKDNQRMWRRKEGNVLFNDKLNECGDGRKEGNVLFNDTLNKCGDGRKEGNVLFNDKLNECGDGRKEMF